MKTVIENLRAMRDMLAVCYVPWTTDDQKGGHCAAGVIQKVVNGCYTPEFHIFFGLLNGAAQRCHPALKGVAVERPAEFQFIGKADMFDLSPAIYVNNHLGKDAILAVFDDAIHFEELKLLNAEVSASIKAAPDTEIAEPVMVQHA